MRYLAQIMAVFNWMHERFWRWIFGNAVNGMRDNDFCSDAERRTDG